MIIKKTRNSDIKLTMNCWHCGAPFEGPLSFRSTCDRCGTAFHSCHNCQFHKPGLSNECQIPGTEAVRDREANNFCDEFVSLGKAPPKKTPPSGFDNLFK